MEKQRPSRRNTQAPVRKRRNAHKRNAVEDEEGNHPKAQVCDHGGGGRGEGGRGRRTSVDKEGGMRKKQRRLMTTLVGRRERKKMNSPSVGEEMGGKGGEGGGALNGEKNERKGS